MSPNTCNPCPRPYNPGPDVIGAPSALPLSVPARLRALVACYLLLVACIEEGLSLFREAFMLPAAAYFPQRLAPPVSSALRRFTSVFGMGTGGATALWPPVNLL